MHKNLSRVLLALVILSLTALFGWLYYQSWSAESSAAEPSLTKQPPLNISDFSFYDYQNDQLISRINVKHLYVRPRRFGILRIATVNELLLKQARFEFYETREASPQAAESPLGHGLASSLSALVDLHGMGRITQGKIEGMQLFIQRQSRPNIQVISAQAVLDFKKKRTIMTDAILQIPERGYTLQSKQIIWDDKEQVFIVPGAYQITEAGNRKFGKSLALDFGL